MESSRRHRTRSSGEHPRHSPERPRCSNDRQNVEAFPTALYDSEINTTDQQASEFTHKEFTGPQSPHNDTHGFSNSSRRLLKHFEKDIFSTNPAYPEEEKESDAQQDVESPDARQLVISFAGLHRMRLRKLQIELANRVVWMHFQREEPSDWENLLKEYSK